MRKTKPEFERFISKVDKTDNCWEWKGSTYRFGYGHFRRKINNKWVMYKAHRYSYEFYKGPIPMGAFVCHHCDNPKCVNPDHLFSGTALDNTLDMIKKQRKGIIRNPKHRLLSMDIAKMIRYQKKLYPEKPLKWFAEKFSTSATQISRIINNVIWKEEN